MAEIPARQHHAASSSQARPQPSTAHPAAPRGLLPIPSREAVVPPPPAAVLPIASRQAPPPQAGCSSCFVLPAKPSYVVDTITTPVRKGRRPAGRRCARSVLAAAPPAAAECNQLPRWAQASPSPTGCDPSPVESNVSSLNSSQLQALELESTCSFGFMPGVFAQSWHRKLSETYTIVNCVGEGRSGAVFIVQHKRTEKEYACKFLRKVDHDPETLRREIQTLRHLDHPNIVRLFEVREDSDTVFLLMELCHGGDLYEKIYKEGHLDEETARGLAQQMLSALAYCHASGVVHRDIKPENFLLEKADEDFPTLKLADFGIATCIRPVHISGAAVGDWHGAATGGWPSCCDGDLPGSVPYMAPEVMSNQSLLRGMTGPVEVLAASDLWSCGVALYVMLSGEIPFGEPEEICGGRPPDFGGEVWKGVSSQAIDLIMKLLNPDVEERWTAQQALGHAWLCEPSPSHEVATGGVSPEAPLGYRSWAGSFLRWLRAWRQHPKLRRVAIAAIARKLEEQHETHRVAQAVHAFFGERSEKLRCERLVEVMSSALSEPIAPEVTRFCPGHTTPGASLVPGAVATSPSPASASAFLSSSSASPGSAPARLQGGTRTGLHVRRRMRLLVRSLSGLAEETPTPTPGSSSTKSEGLWQMGSFQTDDSGNPISMKELRHVVDALDGLKDGTVDYTLLLASLLPPEVYREEHRIAEVFELFDLQKRGSIGPRDLYMALLSDGSRGRQWKSKEASLKQITDMLAEFDLDGDGRLNFAEFRAMVTGPSPETVGVIEEGALASI